MLRYVIGYICASVVFQHLWAQTPPVFNLSTTNGLPSSNVYRVCQDKKGFLWIATENGLCRYDGSEIKVWDTRDGLPDNSIIHVSMDFDNHLWACAYNRGMFLLKNENLITKSDSLKLAPEQIIRIVHTRKNVWLISSRKWLYNLSNGKSQLFRFPGNDTSTCKSIIQVSDTSCIFLTQNGLFRYDDVSGLKALDSYAIEGAQVFYPLSNKMLVLSDKTIYIIGTNQQIEKTILLEKKHVWNDVVTDSKGNIWMASGSELMKLENNGELTRYKEFFKNRPMFINDLFIDSWDNIWMATYGAGLYCLWNKDITYLPVMPEKIHHNVNALYSHGNKVFISSLGGTLAQWEDGVVSAINVPCNTLNDFVYFKLVMGDTLVIGKNSGLCFVTGITGKRPPECFCIYLKGGAVSGFIDSRGYLWVGHYNGVTFRSGEHYAWLPGDEIAQRRVNAIYEYPRGTYYFGTDMGLYVYTSDTVKPVFVSTQNNARFITALQTDKAGNLWIGTRGGLFVMYRGQKIIQPYNHQVLSRTKISQLIETADGALWIASHQGVYRYNGKKLVAFTRENGLISNHILSITMDGEKRLWAGTPDGISVIGTERYDAELEVIPRLYITDIRYDKVVKKYPEQISVYSGTKNIIVNFTAIFFPVSSQIKFEYRIKGHTEDWQQLPNRSLVLSSLPIGNYRLEIRTAKASPQDKEGYVTLDINIMPLFYETLLFRIIAAVILIVLIVLFVNYRIQRIRRRERTKNWKKLRIMYLRLQSVQTSLNPHFIFNSLNSILALLKTQRGEQAENYLTGFSKLLRNTLETSSNTSITLEKETECLNQYLALEKIRFAGTFDYEINVDGDIDLQKTKIPVMIVQPFVENALKHGLRQIKGGMGLIKIKIVNENNALKIQVEDNGVGYYTSLKLKGKTGHRSLGIEMVQRQLSLLNQAGRGAYSLNITEKSPGQGTLVEIHLPAG